MSSWTNPAQISVAKEDQTYLKDFLLDAAEYYDIKAAVRHSAPERHTELETAALHARTYAAFFNSLI